MAINENDKHNLFQLEKIESKFCNQSRLVSDLNEKVNVVHNESTPLASLPQSPIGSDKVENIPKPGTAIININTESSKYENSVEMSKTTFGLGRNQAQQLGSLNERFSRRGP